MRAAGILGVLATLLLGAVLASGSPLDPASRGFDVKVDAFGQKEYWRTFAGGKRALSIALGANQTNIGLYVFDAHGNCVGRDDTLSLLSRDDLVVEWLPAQTGLFTIQVKSLAAAPNEVTLIVRQD
jgi:hypothetical protein